MLSKEHKTQRTCSCYRHVLTSVCTQGGSHPLSRTERQTEKETSVLLTRFHSPAFGLQMPNIMLVTKLILNASSVTELKQIRKMDYEKIK